MFSEPKDILDGNNTSILNLIWTLIVHYQFGYTQESSALQDTFFGLRRNLLMWLNCILPDIRITNLSSDWSNGKVLLALVNFLAPNYALNPVSSSFTNIQNAMDVAESELGIPQLLEAGSIADGKLDERAMILYLSYFVPYGQKSFTEWARSQMPGSVLDNFSKDWTDGTLLARLVNSVSGGQFESHSDSSLPKSMHAAQSLLNILKTVTDEQFGSSSLDVLSRLSYLSQFYRSSTVGTPSAPIPTAPDKVVMGQVQIPRNIDGKSNVWLEVDCSDAGFGDLTGAVNGKETGDIPVNVKALATNDTEQNYYHVLFTPPRADIYTFSIFYDNQHIPGSPRVVNLYPPDPSKVKHIDTSKVDEKDSVVMAFDTADAGQGKLKANAVGEIGGSIPIRVSLEPNGTYILTFTPPFPDIFSVDVLWGKFSANAIGESCGLVPLEVSQDGKHECSVTFKPPVADVYTVDVNWDNKAVPGSPFIIDLLPPCSPDDVECALPIYSIPGEEAELLVDASGAGSGNLTANCTGKEVGEVPVQLNSLGGRAYQVLFTPPQPDLYTLDVKYGDKHIKGSPFEIDMRPGVEPETGEVDIEVIPDSTKCQISESPIENVVLVNRPIVFTIDTNNAGASELVIEVDGPTPTAVTAVEKPYKKGTYDISFRPTAPGSYSINVLWSNKPIPGAPMDVKAIDCGNMESYPYGKPVGFDIDVDSKTSDLDVYAIHNDSGTKYKAKISKVSKGKSKLTFSPKDPGLYFIHVSVKGSPIQGSPFTVYYSIPLKPDACRVDGFSSICYLNYPMKFFVDASDAGFGEISIRPTGPKNKKDKYKLSVSDNKDFTYSAMYTPQAAGPHNLTVLWGGKQIPGSPFTTTAKEFNVVTNIYTVENLYQKSQREEEVNYFDEVVAIPLNTAVLVRFKLDDDLHLKEEHVTSEVLGRNSGKVEPEINKHQDGTYNIIFKPSELDTYEMFVNVNEMSLPRMPIKVVVQDKAEISPPPVDEVMEMQELPEEEAIPYTIPKEKIKDKEEKSKQIDIEIGNELKLKIRPQTDAQKQGKLVANVNGTETGPGKLKINQTDEGIFEVRFNPTEPDFYVVDMELNGQRVPSSPFYVNYYAKPISEQNLELDFGDGNIDALSAQCFGDKHGEIPVKIVESAPGSRKFKLKIKPEKEDRYEIFVKNNGIEIKGSPFVVDLRKPLKELSLEPEDREPVSEIKVIEELEQAPPPVDIDEDEAEEFTPQDAPLAEFTQYIGKTLNVKIRPESEAQRNGEVVTNIVGAKTGEAVAKVHKLPDETFMVEFHPEVPDRYTVTINLNGEDVPHTPFIVNYIIPKTDASKCKLIGVDEILHPSEVGSEISLLVDASNAGPGELNVSSAETQESKIKSTLKIQPRSGEKSKYNVYYTPNSHGYHNLAITWANQPIPQSPVHFLAVDTENVTLFPYGKLVSPEFNIDGKDLKLKIVYKGTGTIIKGKLSKIQKGKYKASFTPKEPGLYYLHIYSKDKEIPSSPYVVRYGRPAYPDKCKVVGLEESCFLGESVEFGVDSKDAGDGELKVSVVGPDKKNLGEVAVTDNKDATHAIAFTPKKAGDHKINVTWSDKPIPGSPHKVRVRDLANEQLITKLFLVNRIGNRKMVDFPHQGILETTTDQKTLMTVKMRTAEQKNGKFSATVTNAATKARMPVEVVKESGDTYFVSLQPASPGTYSLSAQLNNEEIPGSPLSLNYSKPPPVASECKIIGLEDHPPTFMVGKNIFFQVDTRLAGDGKVSIKGESPRGKPALEAAANPVDSRLIDVTYVPNVPGSHKVSVAWSGEEVPKSPAHFQVEPIPVYPNGKPISFEFDEEAKESDLHCLVFHEESGNRLKGKINKLAKNRFGVSFKPRVPGLYSINVYVKMREIKNSPFYVRYAAPPKPDAVVIRDVPEEAYIKESYRFSVDTRDAGLSQLKVKVTPPKKGKDGTLSVVDHKDGIYSVDHIPEVVGNHVFSVVWDKKSVPQSPVSVSVGKKVPVVKSSLGSNTNIVPVGNTLAIDVDNVGKHESRDFVRAAVKPHKSGSKDAPVVKISEGKHSVEFTPTVADDYILNLFMHESEVEGSPFLIKAVDKENLSPKFERSADYLPSDVECRKPVSLVLPWGEEFTDGNTDISVAGPEGPCKVEVTSELESSRGIGFVPSVPGDYIVGVAKDADRDEGKAFKVHATEKKSDAQLVVLTPPSLEKIKEPIPVGETEEFDVDTSKAGYGRLKARQTGPGKGKMALRDKGNDIYGLSITPTAPGKCELDVLMNDESINDSPFTLQFQPSLPRPEKCILEDVTESTVVNTPITFTVNAKEAGSGDLSLSVNVPREKPGEEQPTVRVNDNGDQTYAVEYVPNVAGDHTFGVKWSEQSIPASPFTVPVSEDLIAEILDSLPSMQPTKEEEIVPKPLEPIKETILIETTEDPVLESTPPDETDYSRPESMELDFSNEGPGTLTAQCFGDTCGEIPVEVVETAPDSKKFKLRIKPEIEDRYAIQVKYNDREIKKSPFIVDLRKAVEEEIVPEIMAVERAPMHICGLFQPDEEDTDEITPQDSSLQEHTQYVGRALNVKVRPETDEDRRGKVEATVVGDKTGDNKADVTQLPDDTFIVHFNPEEPDRYVVTVKLNDKDVPHTPFVVNYIMPKTDPSKCRLIGKDDISYPAELGTEISLLVDATEAGPGELNVSSRQPDEVSKLVVQPRSEEKAKYDVYYTPNSKGYHNLDFTWGGKEIPDSPVNFLVVDTENVEFFGHGKPVGADLNIEGKDLKLKVVHKETGSVLKGKLSKIQKGKYKASFTPKDPGLYYLHIYSKDKEIPSSPYVVRYGRPAYPDKCKVVGLEESCFLGESVEFGIDSKDAGDGELKVSVVGPDKKNLGEVAVTDNKEAIHAVAFTPKKAGDHKINVTWSDKPVPGSPHKVRVRDLANEQLITKLFLMNRIGNRKMVDFPHQGILETTTDQKTLMTVKMRTAEQKNGKFSATATNAATQARVPVEVVKESGDTYFVSLQPASPGTYSLSAQLNDEEIPGSPLSLNYSKPPPVASECKIIGLEDHPPTFMVGKNIFFQVDTRLAGDGKVSIKGESPRGKPALEAAANPVDSRLIDVTYVPNVPGRHKVSVAWSGEEIPKSPAHFQVEPIPVYPNGKPISFEFDEEAKESDLHCLVFHEESGSRLKGKINKLAKNRFGVSFKPRVPGLYSINVYVKMREIKNSPFYVRYAAPPKPDAVVIRDVPEEAYIKESYRFSVDTYRFSVDTRDAGLSQLKVKVTPPKKGKDGTLSVVDHKDGIYSVDHIPEVVGNHVFSVVWDKKSVPQSPVSVSVGKKVPVVKSSLGSNTNIVPVGNTLAIDVDNVGKHESRDFVRAAVKPHKSGSKDAPVVKISEGKHSVEFTPTVADDYILNLFMHESEVEGSPFLIKAVDKENLSPKFERSADYLPSDVECRKPVSLVLPWGEEFTDDNTDISVAGPEGPCKVEVTSELESSRGIGFVPSVPGDYIVGVAKDADRDEGKAFKVHATEKKSDAQLVVLTPPSLEKIKEPIPVGETEEFDVDTSKAGYGRLKARQTGPGKGKMALRDKGNDIYGLSITPTAPGKCELDVLMNDESINDSPFTLQFQPSLPRPEKCILEDVTESTVVNTPITFTVNAKEAGSGDLSLSVNVPREKPGEEQPTVRVNDNGDQTYAVEYVPNVAGDHTFGVKWSEQSIPASPFTVPVSEDLIAEILDSLPSMQPTKEEEIVPKPLEPIKETILIETTEDPVLESTPPDETDDSRPESMELDFSNEGPGTLTAQCFGDTCGEIPVEVVETAPDSKKFKLRIKPEIEDRYAIQVKYNDREIKKSPFIVDLRKAVEEEIVPEIMAVERAPMQRFALPQPDEEDTDEITPQDSSLQEHTQYVGRALNVKVRPETDEDRRGKVEATVVGDKTGDNKADVTQLPDDTFIVHFNPEEPDRYVVTVKLNDKDVPHTPFVVNYIMPKTDPSKCRLIGKDDISHPADLGAEISLLVDATEAGPGELNVSSRQPDEVSKLVVQPRSEEKAKYDVYYTPNSKGYHNLDFTWGGKEIPDSPVNFLVVDTENVEFFGHGKPVGADLNIEGKDLKLKVVHKETGSVLKGKLSKIQKGKYKASFTPKDPGLYYLHIYSKDKEIPSSPYVVRYGRPAYPDKCKVVGLEESCFLGESVEFSVDSKDAGDGELKVSVVGPDKKNLGEVAITDNKEATHAVAFTPKKAGDHKINVTWSDKPVPGSPHKVRVRDLANEQLITKLFLVNRIGNRKMVDFPHQGILETTTDQKTLMTVKMRTAEQKNGKFSSTATNAATQARVPVEVVKESGDTYFVSLQPASPGTYSLSAQLNDEEIPGSPLSLNYSKPPPVASECKIIGLEDHPPTFMVGKNIFFQVDTRLAGDGKVSIKGESPRGKPALEAAANPVDSRLIDVTYVPNVPGRHKVSVAWSGEEIPKSPAHFQVEPIPVYPNGKPISFEFDEEAKESDLHCLVFHEESGSRLKGKINKLAKNRFGVSFKPRVPGLYSINVYVKMREIKNSPFYVRYAAPPKPDAVVIRDVPEEAYIKESYRFSVDTRDAGLSQLKVKVTPPKKGKDGTLSVVDHKDGIYSVDHIPEVVGNHVFSVVWDKKSVPQSPVSVSVGKKVPVVKSSLGSNTNIVPVGNTLAIDVDNVGKHESRDFVRAAVKPHKSGSKDAPVVKISEGKHSVEFTPTVADNYILNLFMHESEVEGSPFLIKAVDKENLSPKFERFADYLPSDVECRKPVSLVLPWGEEFTDDNTDISVAGPEGPCKVEVTSELESSRGIGFVPSVPGDYIVGVAKDADRDEGKAFKVHATEKKSDAQLVVLTPPSLEKIKEPIPVGETEEFDVDTSKAGYGRLKARQTGPGKGKMALRDKGNDIYGLSITPTAPGKCELDVLMNDESINDSPFTLQFQPSLPRPEKCILEDVTESTVVNTPITFTVNAKEAGSGDLSLSVNVPREKPGEEQPTVRVNDNGDQTYAVEYMPNVAGDHTFGVKWSEQSIPASPFTVPVSEDLIAEILDSLPSMQPTKEEEIVPKPLEPIKETILIETTEDPVLESTPPDETDYSRPESMELDFSNEGPGTLTAQCFGDTCGEIPVEVVETAPDSKKFKLRIKPEIEDRYAIQVKYNDREIKKSPFIVDLRKAVEEEIVPEIMAVERAPMQRFALPQPDEEDTDEITPQDSSLQEHTQYVGRALNVKVRPETDEDRRGKVEATVVGDKTGDNKADVTQLPDDTFIVHFNPEEPDRYVVTVKLNDKDVPHTPFVVNYIMPKTDPSKCRLIGKDDISHPADLGAEISLLVDATEAGPGELNVSSRQPDEVSKLVVQPRSEEKAKYDVYYTPNSKGYHNLDFTWGGKEIPDSPVNFLVVDTENVEFFGHGKPVGADLNIEGKDLKLKVVHKETGSVLKGKLSKIQKGKYKASFTPKDPGLYYLHIYSKDKEIPSSPYVVRYGRPAYPDKCKVVGLEESCFLGESVEFGVDSKDAGDGELKVSVVGPDKKNLGEVAVTDNKEATHAVAFTPKKAGDHKINVTWSDKPVPGSPHKVRVRDLANEQLITKLFLVNRIGNRKMVDFPHQGILETTTDQKTLMTVKMRTAEQKNGKLSVTATNAATQARVPVEVVKESDTYFVSLQPASPGTYSLSAQLNDEEIPGSPLSLNYSKPPPVASECKIIGLEDHPPTFMVGKNIFFQVDTRLAGDGKVSIKGESPRGKPALEAAANPVDSRLIDVTYVPNVPGRHKVSVAWSGEEIPKSPAHFQVEPIPVYPNGKPISFEFDEEAKESDLHCLVFHEESGSRLKGKINKLAKNRFGVSFKPRVPGLYSINVYVKMREIKNSPFYVRYAAPPKPDAVVIRDVPEEAYIKESYRFSVDTRNAGLSQLKVKVTPPKKGKDGTLSVVDHKDGIYSVDHTPDVVGNHVFSVVWDKKSVPQSPVSVSVGKKVPVVKSSLGSNTNIVPVGNTLVIDVDNVGKHESRDFVRAAVKPHKSGSKDAPVVKISEGKHSVEFTPTVADNYILNLFMHESEVEGSPFLIKAVDKKNLSPKFERSADYLPSDVECGKPVSLVLPWGEEFTDDNTDISVAGPEGLCKVKVTSELESSRGIGFVPSVPGDYIVGVAKDADRDEGKAFKVHATEKKSDAQLVVLTPPSLEKVKEPIPVGESEEFDVDTSKAGYGRLKARQTGPGKGKMALRDKGNDIYGLSITPTAPGKCELDVLMNDESINDSPFTLQFQPSLPRPEKCILEDVTESTVVNTPITFTVNAKEAGSGDLSLSVNVPREKPGEEQPTVRVNDNGDQTYAVEYVPNVAGDHTFDVKWSEQSVPRSPFVVPVKEDHDFINEIFDSLSAQYVPENITVDTQPLEHSVPQSVPGQLIEKLSKPKEIEVEVGTALKLKVRPQTETQREGKLTATVHGTETGPGEINVNQTSDGIFEIRFNPSEADHYIIDVELNGEKVPSSPFYVHYYEPEVGLGIPVSEEMIMEELPSKEYALPSILEEDDSSEIVPQDSPVQEFTQFIGRPLNVKIRPETDEQRNGSVKASAVGENTGEGDLKISQLPDEAFLVYFNPKEPDLYRIDVKLNDQDVPHTPFKVRYVMPKTDPTRCILIGKGDISHPVDVGNEISLLVEAIDAGPGELEVTSQPKDAANPSHLKVQPREGEKSKYEISYTPNTSGYHNLDFTWAGQPIPDSPVKFLAVDTEKVELFQYGKPIAADFNIEGKDLKLKIVHKETGSTIKGKLSKVQKGKYKATFSPTEPGLYYLHVFSKDKEIPSSPYVVKYGMPIKPEKCRVIGMDSTCYLGEDINFIVDTKEAGDGSLTITAIEPNKKPTRKVSLTDQKDGTHSVNITPETVGTLGVNVLWGEKHVPGSPFSVKVKDIADEQLITKAFLINRVGSRDPIDFPVSNNQVETTTDQTLLLSVKTRTDDQRNGKFSASVTNVTTKETEPLKTEIDKDTFLTYFQPSTAGQYTLTAKLNEETISETPLLLDYSVPPPDASKCKIIGLEEHPTTFAVGKNISFQVDTRLAGDGQVNIKAECPRGKPDLQANPNSSEERLVDVKYTPNVPGNHQVTVLWSDKEIPQSPLNFQVEPIPVYPNGKPIAFDLDVAAKESDLHSLVFQEESGARLKSKVIKLAKNKFSISFKPRVPGLYSINVYSKMKEIKNSPFYVRYASPPKPEAVKILDVPDEVYKNEPYTFTVDAKDAGISQLKVKVTPPKKSKSGVVNVTDHRDGIYTVQHTPQSSGKHSFDITWDKKSIPQSPLSINVQHRHTPSDHFSGSRSTITESKSSLASSTEAQEPVINQDDVISVISTPQLESVPQMEEEERHPRVLSVPTSTIVLGESVDVDIDVKDIPRGALKVNQSGDGKAGVQFTKKSDGIIGCTITPTAMGSCTLNFLFNDKNIEGSPCTLKYYGLSGVDLEGEKMQVGVLHKFSVGCSTINEGLLEVACGDDDFFAADITTKYSEDDKVHYCTVVPKEAGSNTLSVKYNGHHIIGSPFNVDFIPQEPSSLNLNLSTPTGMEHSGLSANIRSASGAQELPVALSQLLGGQYSIDFVPTQESEYVLTIKCNLRIKREEKEIADRFNLSYTTTPVYATDCSVEGEGIQTGEVGLWSSFTVKAKDEAGDLSVLFDDANSVVSGPLIKTITPSLEYEVKYLVKKSGNFRITLNWNGKDIPGSPFDVACVVPDNTIPAEIEDFSTTIVEGNPLQFSFKPASEIPGGELKVSAYSQAVGVVMGSYERTNEGKYNCTAHLEHQGRYLVQVTWDNRPLEGTPFEVDIVEPPHPEKVKVYGPGLKSSTVGEKGEFTIDTTEAGHGNISVNVTGPEGQFLVDLNQDLEQEKLFLASYLPQKAGRYTIDVTWGGEQVPDSPFIVDI